MYRPRILLTLAALAAAFAMGCEDKGMTPGSDNTAADPKLAETPPDSRLVDANTAFGMNITKKLSAAEPNENVFLSPASISMALMMTWNGAEGETKEAMADALELGEMSLEEVNDANRVLLSNLLYGDEDVQLHIANSIWAKEGTAFREDFLERNSTYYGAEVTSLPFDRAAVDRINGWVEDKTNDKIKDILGSISAEEIMFLVNAIYFKGTWTDQFDKDDTQDAPFTLADGTEVTVPMMHVDDIRVQCAETDSFRAVSLPYGESERFSMYLFLPTGDATLGSFVSGLDGSSWNQWMGLFHSEEAVVELPRFKIEYKRGLQDVLTDLGMGIAFDSGAADFRGMYPTSSDRNVYLTRVIHQSYLDVNEEGTEAAAATVVGVGVTSMPRIFRIRFDRPFFLAIVDNSSGAVLFTGAVYDPAQ